MDLKNLQKILDEKNQPAFRLRQILDWYYSGEASDWEECTVLPKDLRDSIKEAVPFSTVREKERVETDDVIKLVFELAEGGEMVEAVIMKHLDERRTLCLSCQAGCPMACNFCATGTLGLKKNLTAGEMLDMVRAARNELQSRGEQLTNIVYMGMGEPFANYAAVKESIQLIHDYIGIGWRRISVSTCGIVPKILEFAKDFPQVNLAISLHAGTDDKRSKMMPINDRFDIETLMKTCEEYLAITNRKLFFEYLVIDGFNDKPEDAKELAKLFGKKLYHLNLIRFHATEAVESKYGVNWKASTRERLNDFMEALRKEGITFTLRRSFGERVDAACGMLALKQQKTT